MIYPEGAPVAPTPAPTGDVQTYPVRKAIVRGVITPESDVPLYGLAAAKFVVPAAEDVAARGYTVALYSAGRHRRDALVASDTKATSAAHVVAAAAQNGLVLKRGTTYVFVLYGDELAPTAGAVPATYPTPGVNPFATPVATVAPGAYGAPTGTPSPYATPR
ncbi:MAG: hypothetical protein NVSMB21_23230 [Vulcanimicrobiaceae bacterium]